MSIQFTADNSLTGIGTSNSALMVPRTFTFTAKVKITDLAALGVSGAPASIISILTRDYRSAYLAWNGTGWTVRAEYSSTATATLATGGATSEWVSIALVMSNNGTAGNGRVQAYIRRPGQSTVTAFADYSPSTTSDAIGLRVQLGASTSYYNDRGARFIAADAKLWSRVLTQSQIEAEWDQQTPASASDLMVANYFDGGTVSAALTSDVSNISWGGSWNATNFDGGGQANPTYSSDAPTYGPAAPTLSGEDTLPQLEAAGISGTVSATLGAATLSSAGSVPRTGTLSSTLGTATLSSAGTAPVLGTASATLGTATLTSSGVVAVRGALSATLGAVTLSAADLASTRGNVSVTLGSATLSSTVSGVLGEIDGVLLATLGAINLSSVGTIGQFPLERPFTVTVVDNSIVATVLATDLSRTARAVELQATVVQ